MIECKECNAAFNTDKSLHAHLKKHSLSVEEYYHKFFPRYDTYTKELIPFKNKEQYFQAIFINRTNLIQYLQSISQNELVEFLVLLFLNRKNDKNLLYAPSQVELRSSLLPSINLLQKLHIKYEGLMAGVHLINKYIYNTENLKFKDESLIIFQDTREQTPLLFKGEQIIVQGLNFGDYTCKSHFRNIYIERKSAMDLISSFSTGYERMCREFDRAKEINAYIYVLCESDINEMLSFHHKPFFNKKTRVNADFLFHNIREICQMYPNVQFGFCKGRVHMVQTIKKIFLSEPDITKYDLQWLIDAKIV